MSETEINYASEHSINEAYEKYKEDNESDLENEFIDIKVTEFKNRLMKEHSLEFDTFCIEKFDEVKK